MSLNIYVAGPYINSDPEKVKSNIENARAASEEIKSKGHVPIVPHVLMEGWEDNGIPRKKVEEICNKLLEISDVMLKIGDSPGADREEKYMIEVLKREVVKELNDIPDSNSCKDLSDIQINAYLAEYSECASGYRHTYQTIWQAGSVFAAISAGLFALIKGKNDSISNLGLALSVSPLPFMFWYLAIFCPMNIYGNFRAKRLAAIERCINLARCPLKLSHFINYNNLRCKLKTDKTIIWKGFTSVSYGVKVVFGIFVAVFLAGIYILAWNFVCN